MSFVSKVQAQYLVTAELSWKENLALTLLADSVTSVLDGDGHEHFKEYPEELFDDLRKEVIRSQEDLAGTTKETAEKYGLDLKKYLDTQLIDKIDAAWKKDIGVGLQEVYEANENWAGQVVLLALGHGVSPFDDNYFEDWLKEKGIEKSDWRGHQYFEGPYDEALNFVEDALKKKQD